MHAEHVPAEAMLHPLVKKPAGQRVQGDCTHASVKPGPLPEKKNPAAMPVQFRQTPDELKAHPNLN